MTVFNAREQDSQLAELQRTMPDVPLEVLTLEQLAELQRPQTNLAKAILEHWQSAHDGWMLKLNKPVNPGMTNALPCGS